MNSIFKVLPFTGDGLSKPSTICRSNFKVCIIYFITESVCLFVCLFVFVFFLRGWGVEIVNVYWPNYDTWSSHQSSANVLLALPHEGHQ